MPPRNMWRRPKTTKVYLQMPLSERIALLCPDFKILDLSLLDDGTHVGQPGVGLLFLHGERMEAFPMHATAYRAVEVGLPIYAIRNRTAEGTHIEVEAFCKKMRNPDICFRVTLTNDTSRPLKGTLGLLPRSGQEKYMLNQHQEGYSPYRPNHKNWYMLKRTWKRTAPCVAESDMGTLYLQGIEDSCSWQTQSYNGHSFEAADYFCVSYALAPNETLNFTGILHADPNRREESLAFDYDVERKKVKEEWNFITSSIQRRPNTAQVKYQNVFLHCAVQCMQMLAHYQGSDLIATRQGDVGRFVWPYEGVQVLIMLDRIGLSEHTGAAYRYYCERWFVREGENRGMIQSQAGWENFTGSVMWGISEHLKYVYSKEEFLYFLPYLVAMRDWIQRKRTADRTNGYDGIFPCGKGSDWGEIGQFWTFTDSHNVMALQSMAEMLLLYQNEEYETTLSLCEAYRTRLIQIRDELYAGHETEESYIFPHMLGIPFEDSENYSYYTDGAPYLLYTGLIAPGSRMQQQMESFFLSRGQFENGLTGRMTSCSSMWDEAYFGGYGDVWYTMQSETYWIKAWMACGEQEKALNSLHALMRYGMTKEFVIAERYCSIEPWYSPWQPNGSGSARMLEILLTCFGEKRD